jgi:PilZ domain
MSPTPGLASPTSTAGPPRSDPRLYCRYPITLDAQFKFLTVDRKKRPGIARTLNLSSGGVLLTMNASLPVGGLIELTIDWPLLLNGVRPLKLVIRGQVVRSDGNGVAVQVWNQQFRISGRCFERRTGVIEPALARVVMIVDNDLGFVSWLGEIFREAGCQVVPGLSCQRTLSIIKTLNLQVDVTVVKQDLEGVSQMIQALRSAHKSLKIVDIRSRETDDDGAIYAAAALERPAGWQPVSRQEWIENVWRVLCEVHAIRDE